MIWSLLCVVPLIFVSVLIACITIIFYRDNRSIKAMIMLYLMQTCKKSKRYQNPRGIFKKIFICMAMLVCLFDVFIWPQWIYLKFLTRPFLKWSKYRFLKQTMNCLLCFAFDLVLVIMLRYQYLAEILVDQPLSIFCLHITHSVISTIS